MVGPLVSVAVITYNMERYLPALLDSVLRQKVEFPYEVVVDDDRSPDGSRGIILDYAARFPGVVVPSLRDENVGGSRNMYGIMRRCRGRYIAILEGDDWWEADDKLQYQVGFLESHPEYVGMCSNSWCERGEEPTFSALMRDRTGPEVLTIENFRARHFRDRLPSSTDTWVFRNIFRMYPNEDFSLMYRAHAMVWDQPLALILYGKGPIYADPRVVSHHRSVVRPDGTNFQSLIARENRMLEDSRMLRAMEEYMTGVLREPLGDFRLARGDVWVDAAFRALKSGSAGDRAVARAIARDQDDKAMLARLFAAKCADVAGRKIGLHE